MSYLIANYIMLINHLPFPFNSISIKFHKQNLKLFLLYHRIMLQNKVINLEDGLKRAKN